MAFSSNVESSVLFIYCNNVWKIGEILHRVPLEMDGEFEFEVGCGTKFTDLSLSKFLHTHTLIYLL